MMTRAVFAAVAVLVLLTPPAASALGVGDPAPDFRMLTLAGREISYYAGLKGGRPLYLMFWATY